MKSELNHFDQAGNAVMVDVSAKDNTARVAVAEGRISMNAAAYMAVETGTAKKGDVLGVARVAGIMAVKRTPELIPMCHTILIEKATVDFCLVPEELAVLAKCTVRCSGKTGVEMEALCGVSTALLTIYDMCKAVDRGMTISGICLKEKRGGKSGVYTREGGGKRHD